MKKIKTQIFFRISSEWNSYVSAESVRQGLHQCCQSSAVCRLAPLIFIPSGSKQRCCAASPPDLDFILRNLHFLFHIPSFHSSFVQSTRSALVKLGDACEAEGPQRSLHRNSCNNHCQTLAQVMEPEKHFLTH